MKKYIFRKTFNGFYDWLGIIQTVRRQIVAYEKAVNPNIKNDPIEQSVYYEAKHVYKNYL